MTCREVERLLPELLDDALEGDGRHGLDEHLGACAACRLRVKQLEDSLAIFVAHQPAVEAPPTERLWQRVRAEALEGTGSPGRPWAMALIPGLAAAAAAVVLAIIFWPSGGQPGPTNTDVARLPLRASAPSEHADVSEPPASPGEPSRGGAGPDAAVAAPDSEVASAAVAPREEPRPASRPHRAPASRPDGAAGATTSPSAASAVAETPPDAPDTPAPPAEPPAPAELDSYALVVSEWTVRESDQVLTMAEAAPDDEGGGAEPVRTNLYAVVPSSYDLRPTTHVFDPAVTEAAPGPATDPGPEGAVDTSDARSRARAVHVL